MGLVVAGSVLPMEGGKLVWGCHGRGLVYIMGPETVVAGYCIKKEVGGHHLVTNRGASRSETVKVALEM
jgi:hypothetical protein